MDLFRTRVGDREFLIPTAEVPLTNLHANETLRTEDLPLADTADTPCFRSEAGSYGRDTKSLIRVHQFRKVELVRLCDPAQADGEFAPTSAPSRHAGPASASRRRTDRAASSTPSTAPVCRSVAAILEQHSKPTVPCACPRSWLPYLRFRTINPDGTLSC